MDYSSVCAFVALVAGGVYAYVVKARVYVPAFVAGAFLVFAEAIQEVKKAV